MATMKISKQGLDFIKGFESFVPYVYDDLVPPVKGRYREWKGGPVKGTLTIGYGHTDTAKHPLKISQGLRITEAEACEILDVDLDECEAAVAKAVTRKLTQGQFDALVSFAFNCGNGAMRNIARRLNAGDAGAARAAFDLYTKSKGRVLRGLQRRRDGEQALWDEADPAPIAVADTFHPASVDQPEPSDTSEGASEMVDASTVEPDKSPVSSSSRSCRTSWRTRASGCCCAGRKSLAAGPRPWGWGASLRTAKSRSGCLSRR